MGHRRYEPESEAKRRTLQTLKGCGTLRGLRLRHPPERLRVVSCKAHFAAVERIV
jgi:hypothetical protein